jgi:hypothetical protein
MENVCQKDKKLKSNSQKEDSKDLVKKSKNTTDNTAVINATAAMVKPVASLLNEIINDNTSGLNTTASTPTLNNNSSKTRNNTKCIFSTKKPPSITIMSYLERIIKYTGIEESTLILTLIYIDRLCDMNNIQMTNLNIHRY